SGKPGGGSRGLHQRVGRSGCRLRYIILKQVKFRTHKITPQPSRDGFGTLILTGDLFAKLADYLGKLLKRSCAKIFRTFLVTQTTKFSSKENQICSPPVPQKLRWRNGVQRQELLEILWFLDVRKSVQKYFDFVGFRFIKESYSGRLVPCLKFTMN